MSEGLKLYAAKLREWNTRINLVSPETLKNLESRHLADSCQLLNYLPSNPQQILDLGTGAGLPGLVLAIEAPHHHFTLIESDSRKCAFLRTIIQELNLKNTQVLNQRLETLPPTPIYTIITARAFAPLSRLLPQSKPLLTPEGRWLLLKGEAVDEELRACETLFPMTTQRWPSKVPSISGQQGWVLEIIPKSA